MTAENVFSIANTAALVTWILLAALPGRRWVSDVTVRMAAVMFASAYAVIVATRWAGSSGGFSSLAAVAELFTDPWLLLAGWLHYLAFDLLVGWWETRDASARGIPHVLVIPCLALTFLFGPAGWLSYVAIAAFQDRRRKTFVAQPSAEVFVLGLVLALTMA